jgi:hypothetical protein
MMAVMELVDRPGRPLYHVEHYISGHNILSHLQYIIATIELADRPGRPLCLWKTTLEGMDSPR